MQIGDDAGFWLRLAAGALAGGLTWFAAWAVGGAVVRRALPASTWAVRGVFGAALGYALLGSGIAALGAAHMAGLWQAIALTLAGALVAAIDRGAAADVRAAIGVVSRAWSAMSLPARSSVIVTAFAFVTGAVAAALPPVFWDPIAYHLPILRSILATRSFVFDPGMTQTGFPLLGEAAAFAAFAIAGSSGASFATLGAGIALVAVCGLLAHRIAPGTGAVAAMLVATSPLWGWLAPTFYVDIPFALFIVAALALPLVETVPEYPWRAAGVCGALAGAAAAVKYPGLVDALLVSAVALVMWKRDRAAVVTALAAGACLLATAWYVRDLALTGDPVYPFLSAHLGSTVAVRTFATRYVEMTANWCGGKATVGDFIALPWRMLTDPRAYCGDPGFALRLACVLFVAGIAAYRRLGVLLGASALLTLLWFISSRQDRFIVPAMCIYAVVAAASTLQLREELRRVATILLAALGALGVLADWVPSLAGVASNAVWPAARYAAGDQNASAYLSNRLESYDVARWAAEHLPSDTKIIALDDVRNWYFVQPVTWANPYYQPVWNLDWAGPPRARYAPLLARGYRYMVVDALPVYLGRTPTGVDFKALKADESGGFIRPLYASDEVTLFEIERRR